MLNESLSGILQNVMQRGRGVRSVLSFAPDRPMSLALLLKRWADRAPARCFLIFEGRHYSYREFDDLVARRAAALLSLGIRRGDAVAMMMSNRPEFLINVLALSRLGAAPALINDNLVGAGLRHAVLIVSPTAAIVGDEHRGAFQDAFAGHQEGLDLRVLLDREGGDVPGELPEGAVDLARADRDVPAGVRPATALTAGTDLAAYIYTSGTTGLPKAGRVLNARAFMAGYGFGMFAMGLGARDVFYCCLPLFHSNGFLVSLSSVLVSGSTLSLARKFSASRFWTDVASSGATVFCYIGEVCRYLLNTRPHPDENRHRLRCIIGNGMRPDIWGPFVERFRPGLVHEFYGATEGNVNMINLTGKQGSVGRMPPIPKLDNALLVRFDHDAQMPRRTTEGRCVKCQPGEVGELLGRINPELVTQRFDGYVDSEASRSKILRDVLVPGDAYFRSGDLLKHDAAGWFYFVDRIGDTFRWKGENVSTNEVGDAVQRHADIDVANTYGVHVEGADGQAGMVTLVLRPGATFDPTSFYRHVEAELPVFARPAFVRLANTASLTATFKLRKVELVREGYDPDVVTDELFYRDDDGKTYRTLDQDALGRIRRGEVRL